MPELPEVETTRRGIEPHILGRRIIDIVVRQPRLRWPIPDDLATHLQSQTIDAVQRRAKYLLLRTSAGTLIIHLGMSGSLRVLERNTTPEKHDHVDLIFDNGKILRYRDPRRFGAFLWTADDPLAHPLLAELGPEPLDDAFDGDYLYQTSRRRRINIKALLMDSRIVVGVGNIYANESLFLAGIRPQSRTDRISKKRYERLAQCIKEVIAEAIRQGGTTLRDFVREDGQPGYFRLSLNVYGREGAPCPTCGEEIRKIQLNQRSTYYCPHCQR